MNVDVMLKFIFKTIKICVRDMFILPLSNLKEMFILSIVFFIATALTKIIVGYSFLDWRGVLSAVIFLLLLTVICKDPK